MELPGFPKMSAPGEQMENSIVTSSTTKLHGSRCLRQIFITCTFVGKYGYHAESELLSEAMNTFIDIGNEIDG